LAWLAVFVSAYSWVYGAANFLHLCDIAVLLTCLGLWRSNALLISSQAVSSLVVDLAWDLDLLWRLSLGRHLIGGTEYMWDPRFPLWVRLLSLFHVIWPPLLIWTLTRVGYDSRGFRLQAGIAAGALILARLTNPEVNINFAYRDAFLNRAWGPAPVHLVLTWVALVVVVYWPVHRLLRRLLPRADSGISTAGESSVRD
jgi:hypothetical protein